MSCLIELQKENILVSSTILKYEKPDFIYIPIHNNSIFKIKKDEQITIGKEIIEGNNVKEYSSVSGIATKIVKLNSISGKQDFIEIANDFKETFAHKRVFKKTLGVMKKEELEERIANSFAWELNNKKNFVLNCIDDEPYVLNENFYLLNHWEEFLELLDELTKIYDFKEVTICVKSNSSENINRIISMIGATPHIKLEVCPNLYLLGNNSFLLKHLNKMEEDTIILKAKEFYQLFNKIKRNCYTGEKLITISGNGIINPSVISVKIGSKLSDIIKEHIELKEDSLVYFANGLMQGKEIEINNFVITNDLDSLIIMKKENTEKSLKCINCGACLKLCPVGLNPVLFKNKKYLDSAKKSCIHCGLCSYICPANINFKDLLEGER